jgi:hypothetical protein
MLVRAWTLGLALGCVFAGCAEDPDAASGTSPLLPGLAADAGSVTVADSAVIGSGSDAGAQVVFDSGGSVFVPDGGKGCGSVKQASEALKPSVDVVWILDGSGSMAPHALAVGDNMLRFMDGVRMSGADINVVMLTGVAFGLILQTAITDANYHWVYAEVQSHDAFAWTVNSYDGYKQFLRPGAPTHFIVVTDDSSDMPAAQFVPMLTAKHGRPFYFHAVAADGLLSGGSCAGSGPGTEYFNAAMTTKGDQISLCADWAANFKKLQGSVIASAPLPCEYPIPPAPNGQALDPKAVQVLFTPSGATQQEFAKATTSAQCGDNLGWFFDDNAAPKNVRMCPKACELAKAGGGIEIGFGCAPSVELK